MADSDQEINVKHNLDEFYAKIEKSNEGFDEMKYKISAINAELMKLYNAKMPGFGGGSSPANNNDPGGSSTRRNAELRYWNESVKHFLDFRKYTKDFQVFSGGVAQVTGGIMSVGAALLRLSGGGLLGGAAGLMAGMTALGRGVQEDRRAALALGGANVGKMRAAGAAFGGTINTSEVVSNIATAQTDLTSDQFLALKLLGFTPQQIQSMDPSDLMVAALGREQNRVKSYRNKGTRIPLEESRAATSLFGPDIIRTLGAMSPEDMKKRQEEYTNLQKKLDLDKKTQDAYDDMIRKIGEAGAEIETIFVNELVPLAPIITDFSGSMVEGAKDIAQEIPIFVSAMQTAAKDLNYYNESAAAAGDWLRNWVKDHLGFDPHKLVEGVKDPNQYTAPENYGHKPYDPLSSILRGLTGKGGGDAPKGTQDSPIFVKPADIPSPWDSPMSFDVPGGGGFAIPGGAGAYSGETGPHSRRSGGGNYNMAGPESAGAKPVGAIKDRALGLMNYLVNERKWTPVAAAIAAGNAEQESGINPAGPMGDPGTVGYGERGSWGMFQWNRKRLHDLKMKYGDKWRTNTAQYEYFADEAERMLPGWKKAADFSSAGQISHDYEGYADNSTGTRIGNARKWMRAFQSDHSSPAVSATKEHTSMNDMSLYQMNRGTHIRISNPAGASVNLQTAMLGAVRGSFS
jgi:hypothetical protein